MKEVESIDKSNRIVYYNDGTSVTHDMFLKHFKEFLTGYIAGETLMPMDMENFMRRTSGKNLSLLMKGKKAEGYMEGSMDKMLTAKQKIALVTIVTITFVGIIFFIILKNQGILGV